MSDREIKGNSWHFSEADISLEQVLAALVEGDFQKRWEVAKLIPHLGETAITPLVKLLETEETDLELCWFIARILGEFDHPRSISALVNLLTTTKSEEIKAMAATTLASFGKSAIAPLSSLLAEPQWRLLAIQSLAQIHHPDTIEPLSKTFNDRYPATRAAALTALSNFHEPRILPILLEGLEDSAAEVRLHATIGVGLLSNLLEELELIKLLQLRLKDEDLAVSQQAAIALSRCGTETAIETLFQTLQSFHTPVALQIQIVRALSWIESPLALKYLQQTTEFVSAPVCQEVVFVLGRIEQPQLKHTAASILRDLLDSNNLVFQKPEIKQYIALGLGQLKAVQEIESLRQLAADPDARVRLHAIAALKKLSRHDLRRE